MVVFVCEENHHLERPESRLGGDNILEEIPGSLVRIRLTCGVDGRRSLEGDRDANHFVARKHKVEYCQCSKVELVMNY